MLVLLFAVLLLCPCSLFAQFPAVCNTPDSLQTKTCCPNNCGGPTRGNCQNITARVVAQWGMADSEVNEILQNTPNEPQKGTADARYLWPTVVFERVCICSGNYGGVDCTECDFGWTGTDCSTRKTTVIRKSFNRLTTAEKQTLINATRDLKEEMGYWSVIVGEPSNYTSGMVTLQNVSTYNLFIYLHDYVTRDDDVCTKQVNKGIVIDFAHSGPVFPVWHRHYVLLLEKEFQRITGNASFALPYWRWEEDELSLFATEYYGIPSNSYGSPVNVSGQIINTDDWNTVCDLSYRYRFSPVSLNCSELWELCNPENDLAARRPLQRGGGSTYLPNRIEVKIAIAAPSYDAANPQGQYFRDSPRQSFRSRLEGWNIICSAMNCTGPQDMQNDHMHNNVHDWMGGQMDVPPAAVNDPMFNMHHCNVDRILESWMQRFANGSPNPMLLPAYVPASGGHPGHNRDDYMVPFFPLITAGDQYRVAENWGYTYDELIVADIQDVNIPDCSSVTAIGSCPICDANSTCIDCTNETCPGPIIQPLDVGVTDAPPTSNSAIGLGLGLGLGLPLFVALVVIIFLIVYILYHKMSKPKSGRASQSVELTDIKT